jgi:hypothetical protein
MFVRHTSNTDPLYWDERGFTWGLLFPSPASLVLVPSEDLEGVDPDVVDEMVDDPVMEDPDVEDVTDNQLSGEDSPRLIDLRRRQEESEVTSEKLWKDLEDFHGWTDRGRHAYDIAHYGNLGRRVPPWENITRVSRDLYLRHVYPTV